MYAILLGLIILMAAGCSVSEQAPAEEQETEQPEAPETPAEVPAEKEAALSEEAAPVETNIVNLVQQNGAVGFENAAIEVAKGATVTFRYLGEKGKTVINVYDAENKPVGRTGGSGYLTSGQEWTTQPLEKEGVYKMMILYGKREEGTITVK